jgi:hypothetical protein
MSRRACYTVYRFAWDRAAEQGFCISFIHDANLTRHVPVATFTTEREAKAYAHQRNAETRVRWSPFWFTDEWKELTDLTPEEAVARLARKGLSTPPPLQPEDTRGRFWRTLEMWRQWWDRESVNWNEQQWADAWAVFSKLRFYDVVEIEMED